LNKLLWGDVPAPLIALGVGVVCIVSMGIVHDRNLRQRRRPPPSKT
jgi:hypothetical protein